jgi:hypothetical protein
MSTFSSSLVLNIEHAVSEKGMSCLRAAFMCALSPLLYRLFVPVRHGQKWSISMRQPKAGVCQIFVNLCGKNLSS